MQAVILPLFMNCIKYDNVNSRSKLCSSISFVCATVIAMGSFDPSDLGRAYFYCVACPRAETCSQQAWKRASIWGWSEDECRKRLRHHLANSSLHKEEFACADGSSPGEVAAVADVIEDIVTESEVTEPLARRKPMAPVSKPMAPASKRKAEPPTSKDVAQQVIQQLVQMQSGATSSDGGGGDEFRVAPYSRRAETVTLRVLEIQRCHDALVRASKAARHAQTLTASASTAFANEAATLEQCGEIIKALIPFSYVP